MADQFAERALEWRGAWILPRSGFFFVSLFLGTNSSQRNYGENRESGPVVLVRDRRGWQRGANKYLCPVTFLHDGLYIIF